MDPCACVRVIRLKNWWPEDLAEKALNVLMALGDAIRGPGFDEAVEVPEDASNTDKFIAYSGRQP